MTRTASLCASLAVLLAACSGGRAEVTSDPELPARPATATASEGPSTPVSPQTPAPTSTASSGGIDASGKIGGSKMCTQIGCLDRLAIHVTGKLTKGEVLLTAKAGDKLLSCSLRANAKGQLEPPAADACKGDLDLALKLPGQPLAGSPPDGVTPIFSLIGKASPADLELLVVRGRATLHKESLKPSYKTVQPNGPDCQPTCKQADVVVIVK